MTLGTRLFWAMVVGLAVASIAFASRVPERRERGRAAAAATAQPQGAP